MPETINATNDLVIEKLERTLLGGKIALIPLDVAYALIGLGDDAYNKILAIKIRPTTKPCVVLGTIELLEELNQAPVPDEIKSLNLPLGIVTKLKSNHPLTQTIPSRVFMNETVAFFVNMGDLGNRIARHFAKQNTLVIGSSGNIGGAGNHYLMDEVEPSLVQATSLRVDGGPCKYQEFRDDGKGMSSTIVSLLDHQIIRHGLLEKEIMSHLNW